MQPFSCCLVSTREIKKQQLKSINNVEYNTYKKAVSIWLLILLFSTMAIAQTDYTLSGTITDKSKGETLFGASVFLKGTALGVVTNEYGFYSLTAPEGKYTLNISYIGYADINQEVALDSNKKIDVEINGSSTQLQEVTVTADEPERALLRKPEMSVAKMNIATVKQMPVVLGEVDVLKSLQIIPCILYAPIYLAPTKAQNIYVPIYFLKTIIFPIVLLLVNYYDTHKKTI